jgi:hypothetical protein
MPVRLAPSFSFASIIPVLVLVLGVVPPGPAAGQPDDGAVPTGDYHMHVRSDAATDAFRRLADTLGGPALPASMPATGVQEVLHTLDAAGLEHGVLLSLAYMYGAPDIDVENEYDRVRAENDYVAR